MLYTEKIVSFTEAAEALPEINGKAVHPSAVWRWARKGIKGIKLETLRLGGRFITSMEALDRFSKALAAVDAGKNCVAGEYQAHLELDVLRTQLRKLESRLEQVEKQLKLTIKELDLHWINKAEELKG
jgi:hypothetical protein